MSKRLSAPTKKRDPSQLALLLCTNERLLNRRKKKQTPFLKILALLIACNPVSTTLDSDWDLPHA